MIFKTINQIQVKCYILTVGLFFLSAQIWSQTKINQLDSKGLKTGSWEKRYPNNKLRYKGQFKAGKEVGIFYYYSMDTDKFPIIIKEFSRNNDIAQVQFYTTSGILESKGSMKGKNRIGKWFYFHRDGKTVMIEENYENGTLAGVYISYYPTGQISETAIYKNGKLNGNVQHFSDSGVLLEDINYENGLLQGSAKYYDVKGKLIYSGLYEKDKKIGKWQYFSRDSIINNSFNN